MKKPFLTYYNDEYRFLVEAGKEFAKNQPARAEKLNITGEKKDPNVERLLEGFAFLTAKIRERLDDELPQFTDGVMGLLWPHFLRPIPALTTLKFSPRENQIREAQTIESGAEVLSQPVGSQKIACKFRTCWPVRLLPLKLEKVSLSATPQGKHVITFRFQLTKGAKYEKIFAPPDKTPGQETAGDDRIRLFLHSDPPITASLLFLFLTYYVEKTVIKPVNQNAPFCEIPGQAGVAPAGFAKGENLWPDSAHTLAGYRLLQEYFAFPAKFRFIDLAGLNLFTPPAEMAAFEVQIFLRKNFREDLRFSAENFDLFQTPIINLYSESMYSIKLSQLRPEYPATPNTKADHVEVYAIDKVVGKEEKTRKERVYSLFNSFRHASSSGPQNETPRFYKAFSRRDPNNRWETVLAFESPDLQNGGWPEETIMLTATCMDGALPGKEVKQGFIKSISSNSKNIKSDLQFSNPESPTAPIYPPQKENLQWRLLSHMALNFVSLADRNALQELLALYNWPRDEISYEANNRRIKGIREIVAAPDHYVMSRAAIRGTHLTVKLEEDHFNFDRGDLYLFGLLLREALEHFATINSFVRLTVIAEPSGETFTWPPRLEQGIPTL